MTRYIQTNSNDDAGPGVIFITFSRMYLSHPASRLNLFSEDMATAEDIAIFNAENGLDKPFFIQVLNYTK